MLEALTGLEPVVEVLQTSALPLGYSAVAFAVGRLEGPSSPSGGNVSTHFSGCKGGAAEPEAGAGA